MCIRKPPGGEVERVAASGRHIVRRDAVAGQVAQVRGVELHRPTSCVPFALRTHWPGLPPSSSATANTMLAPRTSRRPRSAHDALLELRRKVGERHVLPSGLTAALFVLAPDAFVVLGQARS
jgi:hypothetical protein